MKRKTNRLLSFIFALVLIAGLLPISVFATGNNYTDYDLCEALDAYKKFTEEEYHEDEWVYTIERFGLYDLNHDGVPELFTLGGGRMDYSKIFTYKNKQVSYVHWGTSFQIYDNGIVYVDFSSGDGYILYSYYTMGDDLSLKLAFRFAEWSSLEDVNYSIGEQAYDENSEKVSYQQVADQREKIIGNAQIVNIVYHDNTASERNAVFTNETSVASGSDTTRFGSFYEAYFELLENRKQLILDSGSIFGAPERTVAIADVCGDQTPELIFAAANENSYFRNTPNGPLEPMQTELFIYTFDDGELLQIYSCGYDFMAASGSHTRLFQSGVGEDLWIASGYGDTYWDETYARLSYDSDKKVLSESEIYHSSAYYETDRYDATHDEQKISKPEYTAATEDLEKGATSWIISSRNSTYWQQYINNPHDYIAMTYDEAVEYLSSNGEVVSTADNTAEDNSYNLERFFQNSDLGKGNNELARIAADLSIKTYDNGGLNAESVEGCLIYDLGFEKKNIYSSDYGYEGNILSSHSSFAYTIATKEYKGRNSDGNTDILVIVARGTMSIRELGGDAFTGTGGAYRNYEVYDIVDRFTQAIFSGVYKVVDRSKNYKVLLTGHSLGGAAVNLAAAKLIDKSINNVKIKNPITDVVCYTFGAIDSIVTDGTISKGYENIHNITNFHDSFGPDGWPIFTAKGNTRYGKFGHIDMFWNEIDKGAFGSRKNHDMSTYLEAVQTGIIDYERASNQKIVAWHCPIDIDVYKNDLLVGRVVNDEVISSVTTIPISIVDGSKYMLLTDEEEYTFIVTATDTGTMTFSCRDTATGNDAKIFTDVALEAGKTMTSTVGGEIETLDVKLYVVNDEGAPIAEVQEDGTEAPIEQIAAVNATTEVLKDSTEAAVKQNSNLVPLIIGIGAIVLIGLAILFLRKPQNRNKNRQ